MPFFTPVQTYNTGALTVNPSPLRPHRERAQLQLVAAAQYGVQYKPTHNHRCGCEGAVTREQYLF